MMTNRSNTIKLMIGVFLFALLFSSCAISPNAWTPGPIPNFEGKLGLNQKLTNSSKLDLLGYYGAEEFALARDGSIYCGAHKAENDFSSGAILKINPDDSVEEYLITDNWVTGMQFDPFGNLFAMMHNVGLVQINSDKSIDTLVNKTPEGKPILMGTGLKIASDGVIYFANISSQLKSSVKSFNQLILEMKPTGGVYAYHPKTKELRTISDGNYFGNGLELSPDEDYILLSETSRYRILRYWIKGDKKETSEIFMDNMPGFPNNISKNEAGNYWVGFTTKRSEQLDKIHPKVGMKKFVYALPSFVQPKAEKFGMVLEVSQDGEILQTLFDPEGKLVSEAGAVIEHKGNLYLGGDIVSYVSKAKLE